jgi:hypothetical protein
VALAPWYIGSSVRPFIGRFEVVVNVEERTYLLALCLAADGNAGKQ